MYRSMWFLARKCVILCAGVCGAVLLWMSIAGSTNAGSETVLDADTTWSADMKFSGDVEVHGSVTVPVQTRLTLMPGSRLLFDLGSGLTVEGFLDVRGTPDKTIAVRSKDGSHGYFVAASFTGNIRARSAVFGDADDGGIFSFAPWAPVAYADDMRYTALASYYGGGLDIVHCRFENTEYAVVVREGEQLWDCADEEGNDCTFRGMRNPRVRVWESAFIGGEGKNIVVNEAEGVLDFRYNYWNGGNPQERKDRGDIRLLSSFAGEVKIDAWSASEDMRDPVVVVPGILGSYEALIPQNDEEAWRETGKTEWVLDPVLITYESLWLTLEKNGYVKDETLFAFPYDWRRSNADTAQDFSRRIQEIRNKTQRPFVDVVAHSMGGLVARAYVQSDDYRGDINQVITLGAPNLGSPEAYLKWEGGFLFSGFRDSIPKYVFESWAEHAGHDSVFDFIRKHPIASIQELLPTYDYLYDGETVRSYPEGYPRNAFLEDLNTHNTDAWKDVVSRRIVGHGEKNTITGIQVTDADKGEKWKHGYPDGVDSFFAQDKSMKFGSGDETVPIASARDDALFADEVVEVEDAGHTALPDATRNTVYTMLTGKTPEKKTIAKEIKKLLGVFVFSPVDMQVTAPDGKRVGKNFETGRVYAEIPGAYYTGFGTSSEFVTIPDPLEGEYEVRVQGVSGGGAYRMKAVVMADGADDRVAEWSGTIAQGETQAYPVSFGATVTDSSSAASQIAATGDDAREEEKKKDDDEKKSDKKTTVGKLSALFGNGSEREDASEEGGVRGNETREDGVAGIVSGMSETSTASEEMLVQKSASKNFVWYGLALFFLAALLGRKRLRTFARDFVRGWKEIKIR